MGFGINDLVSASTFGLIGGGDSKGGTGDSQTTPWEPVQPYLLDAYKQAKALYETGGPDYYPNATYAPFSPQQQMAMQLGQNRALMGSAYDQPAGNVATNAMTSYSPYTLAATKNLWDGYRGMDQLNATTQGAYLNSNPYLDSMFNAATRSVNTQYQNNVLPGVNATFGSGGRTGSNAHQTALDMANQNYGNTISDMAANIYGQNYANERTNQLNSAMNMGNLGIGMSGAMAGLGNQHLQQQLAGANLGMQLGQQEWNNIDRLGYIGQQVQDQSQKVLDDYKARFDYYQQRPEQNLQTYLNFLNNNPGSNASQTNVNQENGSSTMDFVKSIAMASFLSDVRLKRNIQQIGTVNGFNWYRWEWNEAGNALGLSGPSQGVLAQEVEAVAPHLISDVGGYKAVNYAGVL